MNPVAQRSLTACAAIALLSVLVAGCAGVARSRADSTDPGSPPSSDPTPVEVEGVAAFVGAATTSPQQQSVPADIERALSSGDLCGLYDGLAGVRLDASSADGFAAQLAVIAGIMRAAEPLVDDTLIDDWSEVTSGTDRVVAALRRGDALADAAMVYDDEDYRMSQARVASWMDRNCA